MLINEVQSVVGISKKSIYYYEEEGLLKPKRNLDNDYRVYDEDDIKKLRTIKFLRELGVSINDLKDLNSKKLSLEDCMKERLERIEDEKSNYDKIKNMCLEIVADKDDFDNIDILKYYQDMNILNRGGFTMREVEVSKSKKIRGAVVSSLVFSLFFIFIFGIITYFQLTENEKMPWILFAFFGLIFITPVIGIIINLVERIKEINKGEEDEASKY